MKYAQKNLTEKQALHEIEKLAETVVRANGQAMQNQYDAETYRDRVKAVKETLWNIMHEADYAGIGKFIGRVIRPFLHFVQARYAVQWHTSCGFVCYADCAEKLRFVLYDKRSCHFGFSLCHPFLRQCRHC